MTGWKFVIGCFCSAGIEILSPRVPHALGLFMLLLTSSVPTPHPPPGNESHWLTVRIPGHRKSEDVPE